MFSQMELFFDYLLLEKRYSNHTITSYRKDISQLLQYAELEYEISDLSKIKSQIIRSWIVEMMEKDYTAKTINRKISSIRSFFNFLKRQKIVTKNPVLKIIAPKIPKRLPSFIRQDVIEKLFDTIGEDEEYPVFRDRMIVELLYSTGMRRAELLNLTFDDIKVGDRLLKVLGKGSKERVIPISPKLVDKLILLNRMKNDHFDVCDKRYLLVTNQGKKLYPKFVYNVVIKLVGSVSTSNKKSPHVLRHSFATHLTNNGADINAIKELLGHANLGATQIYTHNSIAKLKEVYQKTHPKAKK